MNTDSQFPNGGSHPELPNDAPQETTGRFLAAAVRRAEDAAEEFLSAVGVRLPVGPYPFESVGEWYAFDAALEEWLQRRARIVHRIPPGEGMRAASETQVEGEVPHSA